jgi:DNA primase
MDAVAVVEDYLRLEKRSGRYWGLCPFHQEKTPSFTVDPDRKLYYCFGCHKGGTIVDFIMEMDKLSYPEAIETLAKRFGVEIIYENNGDAPQKREHDSRIEDLAELYRKVSGSFHYLLTKKNEGQAALGYIISRGISIETIERFRLGYAPSNRTWLFQFLSGKGYSESLLASSGLFSKKYPRYAFFSDKLMFPIGDRQGRTVAFGARLLPGPEGSAVEGPKYINSAESELYRKGQTLFAIDLAQAEIRKAKSVYLAEGYMDVIALHQAGIGNAVAPLGTAFTDDQAKLLRRWAETVYLIFDSDEAGQTATVKAILTCRRNGLSCSVVVPGVSSGGIGEGPGQKNANPPSFFKDPADILKELGPEALQKRVKCFIIDFEYLISRSRVLFDLTGSEGKSRGAAFLFPYLEVLDSEVSRDTCVGAIADALGVDREAVLDDYRHFDYRRFDGSQNSSRQDDRHAGFPRSFSGDRGQTGSPELKQRPLRMNDELYLLAAVFVNPGLFLQLRAKLSIEELDDPNAKELFIVLEEWFRNDGSADMDALLPEIRDGPLRDFIIRQSASGAFSRAEQLLADGITKVKRRGLERRRAEIVRELRVAAGTGRRDEELLTEKVHIDAELHRFKEATE